MYAQQQDSASAKEITTILNNFRMALPGCAPTTLVTTPEADATLNHFKFRIPHYENFPMQCTENFFSLKK